VNKFSVIRHVDTKISSLSQVKKLVGKLAQDSYVDYRKMTDTAVKEEKEATETEPEAEKSVAELVLEADLALEVPLGYKSAIPVLSVETKPKEAEGTPAKRGKRAAPKKVEPKEESLADGKYQINRY